MRSKVTRVLIATLMLAVLSGCARYSLVPPSTVTVRNAMTVQPGTEWNRIETLGTDDTGRLDYWTVDGEQLHLLILLAGVEDGKPLFNGKSGADKPPAYRTGMASEELASLFEASFTKAFLAKVYTLRSVKPVTVAGGEGLRMDFTFAGDDELDREGVAVLVQRNGKLYVLAHEAPRLYFHERYAAEVERLFASLRIPDKS